MGPSAIPGARPLSCQFMIIDNETTDKLLRDFFDSTVKKTAIQQQQQQQALVSNGDVLLEKPETKSPVKLKEAKKKKFSTFRIFMKSHGSGATKKLKSKSKQHKQRVAKSSGGFVNCITSSGTSSASSLKDISENKEASDKSSKNEENLKALSFDKSYTSLNSKLTSEIDYDVDAYNEIHNLEKCPIAASDLDLDYADDVQLPQSECLPALKNSSPFSNMSNSHCVDGKSKTNDKTGAKELISVPLNSYLYYSYEKKENTCLNNKVREKSILLK